LKHFQIPFFRKALSNNHILLATYAALVSFLTYSCMYAFRKPYTAATFETVGGFAVSYKVLLVIAQLVGYTISKFLGIKIIAELKNHHRAPGIIGLIALSWFTLALFAFAPPSLGILCLFLNGLPLGLIWGLVFSYLEGRKTTELMGAVLTVSFIFSSGFVKSVGKWLMVNFQVSEFTMPFLTGAIFIIPIIFFVFLLEQIPAPSEEDKALRTERLPMSRAQRIDFLKTFLPGIVVLVVTYILLSIIRDFRDNFAADIWKEAGFEKIPSIFTITEIPASVTILIMMSFLIFVKNNFTALRINHWVIIAGFGIALASTFAFLSHLISPVLWMTLNGLGLYMGYVPFNCMLFERMIAAFKKPANVGFLMYISDSFGYLGSIGVLLYKEFSSHQISWTGFFSTMLILVCFVGILFTIFSEFYFSKKKQELILR
jgi:MFS family permease